MARLIAVTGCAGFLGTHLTEALLARGDYVYGLDALTYAANPEFIVELEARYASHFRFRIEDICTLDRLVPDVDAIINLAAETHVDNSLQDPTRFVETNVVGVQRLLELARGKRAYSLPRFIQISTDEAYGSVRHGESGEADPLAPSSPYSASKAAADLLVQAWGHAFDMPWNIVRPSNLYGERQFPEKLIPKTVRQVLLGRKVPVHGDGTQVRSWLDVKDCVSAILAVLDLAPSGVVYNVPGNTEASVLAIVQRVAAELGAQDVAELGFTRAGIDLRYRVNGERLRALGWQAKGDFWQSLPSLVEAERGKFRW
jgi:dTDP-glucose 4,6-dehydratase